MMRGTPNAASWWATAHADALRALAYENGMEPVAKATEKSIGPWTPLPLAWREAFNRMLESAASTESDFRTQRQMLGEAAQR